MDNKPNKSSGRGILTDSDYPFYVVQRHLQKLDYFTVVQRGCPFTLSLTRAEPLGFFTISSITPDTFDLAVVNCEPTVRVMFDIFASFYLIYYQLLLIALFYTYPTTLSTLLGHFLYNDFRGKLLYFLT
jgi:hypothetical protein